MKPRARVHRSLIRSMILAITGVCLLLGLTSCSSQPSQDEPPAQQAPPAAGEPQRHDLRGTVVSIDKAGKSLTVNHEEIPGLMGAMTMPYPVKDESLLDNLSPGDQVNAQVVVEEGAGMWLENIVVAPKPAQ